MYKINYSGDGMTTNYTFVFPFFSEEDVKVSLNSVLLGKGDYTISVEPESPTDGKFSGGSVIFNTPPAVGAQICIWRKIMLSRTVDYQPTLPISTDSLNTDFNFILEYLRDIYDIDGHAANIENGMQFLDSIQAQITEMGDLSELARKSEIPDLTEYAKISDVPSTENFATLNHVHDMSEYATKTYVNQTRDEIENEIPEPFPIDFEVTDEPDIVIKTQVPTSENNYTWYRLYKSGWVEQGGFVEQPEPLIYLYANLPITMADNFFSVLVTNMQPETPRGEHYGVTCVHINNPSQLRFASNGGYLDGFTWRVSGFAAQNQSTQQSSN